MAIPVHDRFAAQAQQIPLLDASSLPFADDWALLESLHGRTDMASDFEADFDRLGRIHVSAAYDE